MRKMTRKPPWPAGDDHKKPDTTSIRYVLGVAQKYTAGTEVYSWHRVKFNHTS